MGYVVWLFALEISYSTRSKRANRIPCRRVDNEAKNLTKKTPPSVRPRRNGFCHPVSDRTSTPNCHSESPSWIFLSCYPNYQMVE